MLKSYTIMSNKKETSPTTVGKVEVFSFSQEKTPIRVQVINGEPWFVAKDVAEALQYSNPRDAIKKHCKEKGVAFCDSLTEGGIQKLKYINEGNMYRLIVNCTLPKADIFEEWIFDEVLPSIRKTGRYESKPLRKDACRMSRGEGVRAEMMDLLWLIGESLEHGDQARIALELGVSRIAVNRTLNGYNRSSRILAALYRKARENREKYLLQYEPGVMAERLRGAGLPNHCTQGGDSLPELRIITNRRGGQPGNQNARKHGRKESK